MYIFAKKQFVQNMNYAQNRKIFIKMGIGVRG